jgi:hypothetical protein
MSRAENLTELRIGDKNNPDMGVPNYWFWYEHPTNQPHHKTMADKWRYKAHREFRKYRYYINIMRELTSPRGLPPPPDRYKITAKTLKGIENHCKAYIKWYLKEIGREDMEDAEELKHTLGFLPSFLQRAKRKIKKKPTAEGYVFERPTKQQKTTTLDV